MEFSKKINANNGYTIKKDSYTLIPQVKVILLLFKKKVEIRLMAQF